MVCTHTIVDASSRHSKMAIVRYDWYWNNYISIHVCLKYMSKIRPHLPLSDIIYLLSYMYITQLINNFT